MCKQDRKKVKIELLENLRCTNMIKPQSQTNMRNCTCH